MPDVSIGEFLVCVLLIGSWILMSLPFIFSVLGALL